MYNKNTTWACFIKLLFVNGLTNTQGWNLAARNVENVDYLAGQIIISLVLWDLAIVNEIYSRVVGEIWPSADEFYSRVWMRSGWVWMRSGRVWMRSGRVWMRSGRMWMRSIADCGWDRERLTALAKDAIYSRFDTSLHQHCWIWGRHMKQCWI